MEISFDVNLPVRDSVDLPQTYFCIPNIYFYILSGVWGTQMIFN